MSNLAQRSLASGEVAPALYGRTDLTHYASGLKTCLNWVVKRSGGLDSRAGTEYIATAKDSSAPTRLLKFVFNDEQTYILVFGEFTMRVVQNGAQLESSPGVPYELATPYLGADLFQLQYVQSGDVITITHQDYAPRDLTRLADTNWTLITETFAPSVAIPTGITVTGGTTGPIVYWSVSALASDTYEESLPSPLSGGSGGYTPTPTAPITVTWTAVAGASRYNIYRSTDGTNYAYVGASSSPSFMDTGFPYDYTVTPPIARNPFPTPNDYPATVGYYQQRRIYGDTINRPETVFASRSAYYKNFTTTFPVADDNAILFTLVGRKVSEVRHFLDLVKLFVFTSSAVWSIEGDAQGVLTPTNVNPRQQSGYGANDMPPLVVGSRALYVQARGTIVRDITSDLVSGVKTTDLTLFSTHLFDRYTLVDWDYQEIPNSIVWIARSDGVLLALTYIPDQQVFGWTRCVTDGIVESVCTVPEGNEDRVYLVVNRDGVRMIERMASRLIGDIRDYIGMDCTLSYDGRNTDLSGNGYITLEGGTTWDQYDTLQAYANIARFAAGDIGKGLYFTAADGADVRTMIVGYTSPTQVQVAPTATIPFDLRVSGTLEWRFAVQTLTGLHHLEGKAVSILGDGYVASSPFNDSYDTITVTGGSVTLDRPYAVIRVGLPFISDLETLDIDTPQGPSLRDKPILVNRVGLTVEATRGLFAGQSFPPAADPLAGLYELPLRDTNTATTQPPDLMTETVFVDIKANWRSNGRFVVRQVDPIPASILALLPTGNLPVNG